jgi:hypothetical protein
MTATPDIDGAREIVAALGWWPSFHDAKILSVHVLRGGPSTVTLRVVDVRRPPDVVTFVFEDIEHLELGGEAADKQNVIEHVSVDTANGLTTVTFYPCYGLSGYITAKRVGVRIESPAA